MTTVLLHGFWGQPSDWNDVINRAPLGASILAPDLYASGPLAPTYNLNDWAKNFWAWLDHELSTSPIALVGYSMGGRLALTALTAQPKRVARALILSANPYLPPEAHAEREQWEQKFLQDFRTKDWAALEAEWQDQSVFTGSTKVPRRHKDEMRELLGLSLVNWSPRLHPFGREILPELPATCAWAFGALDDKYLEVAKTLAAAPIKGQITILPQAGHRLLTDAPEFVAKWIKETP